MSRPPVCPQGKVLVVTGFYPPNPTASSMIMHNLLKSFDPGSYVVATADRGSEAEAHHEAPVHVISSSFQKSSRVDKIWQQLQEPIVTRKVIALVRRYRPAAILGVYPDYLFLNAAAQAARATKTPWAAYLHDTVAEALEHTPYRDKARALQDQMFREAGRVLVMSQGMSDLYERKYGLRSYPLEHTYPEPIPTSLDPTEAERSAFWSGTIYGINARAVSRMSQALDRIGCPFRISTPQTMENLRKLGVVGDQVSRGFAPSRKEYLEGLRGHGVLLLGLDQPGESPVHEDELGTIFSTKTPEYLAAGRPILAHCPEHYFLARFIQERGCGLVVSEPSVDALARAFERLLEGGPDVEAMRRSALEAARLFSPERTSSILAEAMEAVAAQGWKA